MVNWCPNCNTAISDAEVEYKEEASHLWHLRYQIKCEDRYVEVATTRPETMLEILQLQSIRMMKDIKIS